MSRRELRVDPTRTISADADQVHQHLDSMLGEIDSGRLVVVVIIHRHLLDLEVVRSGNEQTLEVEPEPTKCLTREDLFCGIRGKAFEPRLGVENSRKQDQLGELVEQAAHEVARIEIVEKRRTHYVTRFRQNAAGDDDVASGLQSAQDLCNL